MEKAIKLFSHLQSRFIYLKTNEKDGMKFAARNNRLIVAFKHPLAKAMLVLLYVAVPPLVNLNLLEQRSDPLIHILYYALFVYLCQATFEQACFSRACKKIF